MLYQNIRFACSFVPPCLSTKHFYRTLEHDPSLGRHCKELTIYIPEPSSDAYTVEDYDLPNKVLRKLPNVTSLTIQAAFGKGNGPLLWKMIKNAVEHMPNIQHISLPRESQTQESLSTGLLPLPGIIEHLNLPRLTSLELQVAQVSTL